LAETYLWELLRKAVGMNNAIVAIDYWDGLSKNCKKVTVEVLMLVLVLLCWVS
jgi:hypothetical protein